LILFACLLAPLAGLAQSNVTIARLTQDVQSLQEQLGKSQLQLEVLERKQQQLLSSFDQLLKNQQQLTARLETLSAQTETRINALPEREQAMKREIIGEVSKQIQALAGETQKAIDALSDARSTTPSVNVRTNFSSDYPENGVVHVVKPGETISGIARKYGSTINYIMDANQIANATGLKAGETIFVPVPQ
ncbi:MAG: LysM peptidoglycan-binding domain-containing protein, partial [Puniceicoccales bacterium]